MNPYEHIGRAAVRLCGGDASKLAGTIQGMAVIYGLATIRPNGYIKLKKSAGGQSGRKPYELHTRKEKKQ